MDELEAVARDTARYRETGAAHEQSRAAVTASVLAAMRARRRPTVVAAASPFTETYVRKLARKHGIPEYLLDRYPQARAELEARMPGWREAAAALGGLDIGLDDEEFAGGVLWYGLTRPGSEASPARQERIIVDRLVRWATRDGGDAAAAAAAAAAISSVLHAYLPAPERATGT